MRTTITTTLLVLVLGLLLRPPAALAAPAVTITPAAVPPGGTVTIAGVGFAPAAPLELISVNPEFADARVKLADLVAGAAGAFTATVRVPGFNVPGSLIVVIVGGGVDLAQASITVTDAPSIAPERLAVAPGAGPAGTRFAATGTGLTPGLAVTAFTTESTLGPAGHFRAVAAATVAPDGRLAFPIDSSGYDPEDYDLIVFGPGGPAIGFPLVLGQFTVTAPRTMPGLPNTGGGGLAARPQPWPVGPLAGFGALLCGLVVCRATRRRCG